MGDKGVGPCVAFSVYNPILCKGVLAHLDSAQLSPETAYSINPPLCTNIDSIISACSDKNDRSQCSCIIYSRVRTRHFTEAVKYLHNNYPEILCQTIIGYTGGIILNAKTGKTYESNSLSMFNLLNVYGLPALEIFSADESIKWR
jgi:hypothetical protein